MTLLGGDVVERLDKPSSYVEARARSRTDKEFQDLSVLDTTSTLYVGNLSFYTTEEQIYELFSKCGEIKKITMGLDRFQKTPCGFCFVEYQTHQQACDCMRFINGTKLDERLVRTDLDPGFKEGRQYGRGRSGGQVRDEYRKDYDPSRGGWGKIREHDQGGRPVDKPEEKSEEKPKEKPEEEFETKTTLGKRGRDPDDDGRQSAAESSEE